MPRGQIGQTRETALILNSKSLPFDEALSLNQHTEPDEEDVSPRNRLSTIHKALVHVFFHPFTLWQKFNESLSELVCGG